MFQHPRSLAALTLLKLTLLTACGSVDKPAVIAAPARVDCWSTIPADLKAPPEKIPDIAEGDNKFEWAALGIERERRKDRKTVALQAAAKACGAFNKAPENEQS